MANKRQRGNEVFLSGDGGFSSTTFPAERDGSTAGWDMTVGRGRGQAVTPPLDAGFGEKPAPCVRTMGPRRASTARRGEGTATGHKRGQKVLPGNFPEETFSWKTDYRTIPFLSPITVFFVYLRQTAVSRKDSP